MSLSLNFSVQISDDNNFFVIADTTGAYSSTNTGGYGTPNPATTDVVNVVLKLTREEDSIQYKINLTVKSGTITGATLVNPDTTTSDAMSFLTDANFPFTSTNPIKIPNIFDGATVAAPTPIKDNVYAIDYSVSQVNISGTIFSAHITKSILQICSIICCNTKQFLKNKCGCDCNDKNTIHNLKTWSQILTSQYAANLGQYNSAKCALRNAQKLCTDCGCN